MYFFLRVRYKIMIKFIRKLKENICSDYCILFTDLITLGGYEE